MNEKSPSYTTLRIKCFRKPTQLYGPTHLLSRQVILYLYSNFKMKKIFRYLIVTPNVWMRIQKGIGTIVYYAASILLRRAFLSRLQAKKPTWIQETFCPSYFYWLYHHSLFTFRPATKQCCQKSFNQVNETFFFIHISSLYNSAAICSWSAHETVPRILLK